MNVTRGNHHIILCIHSNKNFNIIFFLRAFTKLKYFLQRLLSLEGYSPVTIKIHNLSDLLNNNLI